MSGGDHSYEEKNRTKRPDGDSVRSVVLSKTSRNVLSEHTGFVALCSRREHAQPASSANSESIQDSQRTGAELDDWVQFEKAGVGFGLAGVRSSSVLSL